MGAIVIRGVDRPAIGAALLRHGLGRGAPVAALIGAAVDPPLRPALVEVVCAETAATLLGRGADDVVLASDPDLLVAARLAALVRRSASRHLVCGEIAIDTVERQARRAGRPLALLPREYALLLHLARAGGAVVSRAELTRAVLGLAFEPGTNILAVHCSRLRTKLHQGFATPALLTERGSGYRLAT